MKHTLLAILSAALLSSCIQTTDVAPVSEGTVMQLSGTWIIENNQGNIRFYSDETVKITMPLHNPPIKLLSPYEAVKEHTLGIALGGFWSGPILVDTSKLNQGVIIATLPEEEAITLHKQ